MENFIWEEVCTRIRILMTIIRGSKVVFSGHENAAPITFEHEFNSVLEVVDHIFVPLDEYYFIRCRLLNAEVYYNENENGAARYELELALRRLRKLQVLYSW